jgi:hypothetical protein
MSGLDKISGMAAGDAIQPNRPWGAWAVRTAFLLVLAGSVAGILVLRKDYAKQLRAFEDSAARRRAESYELYRRIQKLSDDRDMTPQRVQVELAIPLVEAGRKGRTAVYALTDPSSGSEFGLTFVDECLQRGAQLIPARRPERYKVHAALEAARREVLSWGGLVWLAVAAQLIVVPRWRRAIADGALAVALLFVAAVVLHEGTRLGLYIGGVHWSVLLACAIGPASLLAAWLVRVERSSEPLCRQCRYNLLNNASGARAGCARSAGGC